MTRRATRRLAPLAVLMVMVACATPPPAQAFDPTKPICTLAGLVSTLAGRVCSAARRPGDVLKAGQKLLTGHVGGALQSLAGASPATKAFTAAAALAAAGAWVVGGARIVLRETARVVSTTTRPQLQSTWFSASYWRMASIAALLTLPFLFAAAVQAILRSDLSLLLRSALGYLPLGLVAVSIAAPFVQLLLAASDELSSLVSSASGYTGASFTHASVFTLGTSALSTSAFPLFFVGLLAVAATMTLWIELLIRAAAVYVIVLMLPLFFAALVWPARRVWAIRAVELLAALILSKFAIVAVLALGSAALGHAEPGGVTRMLAGTTLVLLAAFTPWGLLRLLPFHELASGLDGLRSGSFRPLGTAQAGAEEAHTRTTGPDTPAREEGLGPVQGAGAEAARTAVEGLEGQPESTRSEAGQAEASTEPVKGASASATPDERPAEGVDSPVPAGAATAGEPRPPGTRTAQPRTPDFDELLEPRSRSRGPRAPELETLLNTERSAPLELGPGLVPDQTPADQEPELRPEPQEPPEGTL